MTSAKLANQPIQSHLLELAGRAILFQSLSPVLNLSGREILLFISIKNRRFTKQYLRWFTEIVRSLGQNAIISIVDEPYLYNRMADLSLDSLPQDELLRLDKIAEEVTRRAHKAINAAGSDKIQFIPWRSWSDQTPECFKQEVLTAFTRSGPFRDAVIDHVRSVKGNLRMHTLEAYAKFFLCEIPVLVWAYYRPDTMVADVYPGEQAKLFWQIESGEFHKCLPLISQYASVGTPLLYLNTMAFD